MKSILLTGVMMAASGLALATLPPPDEAAKAKAAEAAAKSAWQGKVNAYLLCKAQDKVVARYLKTVGTAGAQQAGAGAAALPTAPCADPGAYTPPAQKPLETSGAHSPSGNAASPPSVKQPSAAMAPAGKS